MSIPSSTTGRTVGGRYTLRSPVGAGGMGTVWRAHDEVLRRDVAVKEVLLPPGIPDEERHLLCERTMREARAAARLANPSVVTVYDVVEEDDRPWIVMELVEARSLADVIRDDGPLPADRTAEIGLQVLNALEAAHRIGILHRDVKPANVLVDAHGRVTLTDFGVARSPGDSALTSTGLLVGSPSYISPERARGLAPGPPSDLWSLGATLYAAVEGRPPFDRGDPVSTLTAVVGDPPGAFTTSGPLVPVLEGLLDKDPATRWDAKRARAGLRAIVSSARTTVMPTITGGPPAGRLPTGRRTPSPAPVAPITPPAAEPVDPIISPPAPTAQLAQPIPAPPNVPGAPLAAGAEPAAADETDEATQMLPRALSEHAAPAEQRVGTPTYRRHSTLRLALIFLLIVALTATVAFLLTRAFVGKGGSAAGPSAMKSAYVPYEDPLGYTVKVPRGWTKTANASGNQVQFADRSGRFLRLRVEQRRLRSAETYLRAADRYNRRTLDGYRLLDIRTVTVADRQGAEWEFLHTKNGPRHVLDRALIVDRRAYTFYLSTPQASFAGSKPILDAVTESFQPPE